ncbi:hypothetical protein BHM03_00055860 [Ensete ventricosum]|nr:hypothetical protein BHM03_00055860 [Ensete ventricosum]
MHPLMFPNSGIRAKRRQRGGGAASGGQPRLAPMQGQPPTARPRPRTPVRGWPVAAMASPQGRPAAPAGAAPVGRSAACGHSRLKRGARKGGWLQDTRKGLPLTRAAVPTVPWQGSY